MSLNQNHMLGTFFLLHYVRRFSFAVKFVHILMYDSIIA